MAYDRLRPTYILKFTSILLSLVTDHSALSSDTASGSSKQA